MVDLKTAHSHLKDKCKLTEIIRKLQGVSKESMIYCDMANY
jgi:hypothetical protein